MRILRLKGYLEIKCRACGHHLIPTYQEPGRQWQFNGDMERPTITPSVKETCNDPSHPSYNPEAKSSLCHFFVTNGQISYCGDCSHDLRGQTLELQEFSPEEVASRKII